MKKFYLYIVLGILSTGNVSIGYSKNKITTKIIKVVDNVGNPLPGVNVISDGNSTTTDFDGNCIIKADNKNDDVSFKLLGYQDLFIAFDNLKSNVILQESGKFLKNDNDIIDLGLITRSKREINSSVGNVNILERVEFDASHDVSSHIDGLVAGMKNGVNVRGISDAIYVIDGVPNRDISFVDVNEIESISVLKDAASLLLYGAQGYDGVIVVKTKRGSEHKNKVRVTADYGLRIPIIMPEFLNASEYMTLYNEARHNDGLSDFYGDDLIKSTYNKENPYKYPDIDFYSDQYLKSFTDNANLLTEFSGGNENLKYYVALNYGYNGTLEKTNPEVNKGKHDFRVRGNIDFKVNSWIKSSVSTMLSMESQKMAKVNVLNSSINFKPNMYSPLLPVSMFSEELLNNPIYNTLKIYDGYVLGGSFSYKNTTPIANIMAGGYDKSMNRTTQISNSIDFDLSMITQGLSAKTFINFDYLDNSKMSITNQYNFYEPIWEGDQIVDLKALGLPDKKDQTENISTTNFLLKYGFYGMLNYDRTFGGKHGVKGFFLANSTTYKRSGKKQTDVMNYMTLGLDYNFMKKYYVNFTAAYSHSNKMAVGHRGAMSPSLSLGYVVSDESFFKNLSISDKIDYLKFKASWGQVHTDNTINEYYLYSEQYQVKGGGIFSWADGQEYSDLTKYLHGGNNNMRFQKREDYTLGLETSMFNKLYFEANYYRTSISDFLHLAENDYPTFYNDFAPYRNYGLNRFQGFEINSNYKIEISKDFDIIIGGNFLYNKGKIIKTDELKQEYDYLKIAGRPVGYINGMVADGFYQEDDFNPDGSLINGLPKSELGNVKPGDIKYKDLNKDGIINSTDDVAQIGCSSSPYMLGLEFNFRYKNWKLYVVGKGEFGGDAIKNNDSYYWISGDDKYSSIVKGRWTPENADVATYPRLTTGNGSNNFRNSTFWLYDNSYFDIRRAQITYDFSKNVCKKIGISDLSLNLIATNLWKFSRNKDIQNLNVTGDPKFRTISLGFKVSI